jgi:hypothetical protein
MRTVYGKFEKIRSGRGRPRHNLAVAIENKGSKSNFVHAQKFFGKVGDTYTITGFDTNDMKNIYITASKNVKIYVRRERKYQMITGPVSRKLSQDLRERVRFIHVIIV